MLNQQRDNTQGKKNEKIGNCIFGDATCKLCDGIGGYSKRKSDAFSKGPGCVNRQVDPLVVKIDEATTTVGDMRKMYTKGFNKSPVTIVFIHEGKPLQDDNALVKKAMDLRVNDGVIICERTGE